MSDRGVTHAGESFTPPTPVRALESGRGHGRWDYFLGNLTRGRRRASGRKRSFTSILELESFVQVKELSDPLPAALVDIRLGASIARCS